MCLCCCRRCCTVMQQKICVYGFAIIFLVLGLLGVIWWPSKAYDIIYKDLPLSPHSRIYSKWVVTPIPVYMYMYLFNWTNPEQVHVAGVKPNFQQLGPYVFRERKIKEDITWHPNKTVTFYGRRTWFFEPDMSGGSLNDPVTAPHLPSLAACHIIRDKPKIIKIFFNGILNKNGGSLYQTHTANEWLFEGFFDRFLDYAMKLNNSMISGIDTNQFAWLLNRNGSKTAEGAFTVHTGQGDLREMGEIKFWNGRNHTGYYEGECGRINGSTTDLFVPNRGPEEVITVYITDTCRIINLVPTEREKIKGLEGIRYETKPDTFDNGQLNPDMKCYCPKNLQPDNCPKPGVTDLSPCAQGAPMYMSHGHFLYADPSFANTITGMNASYENNRFFITMEPKLGVPLEVSAAVQVSILIQPDKDITILRNVPTFYAPLFITANKALITKELASEVKMILSLPRIGRCIGIVFLVASGILFAVGIYYEVTKKWVGRSPADEVKEEVTEQTET